VSRLLYKPIGAILGILGGVLAGAVFKRMWAVVSEEAEPPTATQAGRSWAEVLGAAAAEGATYALVKAAVDRGGAVAFEKMTGVWPGKNPA